LIFFDFLFSLSISLSFSFSFAHPFGVTITLGDLLNVPEGM